MKKVFYSFIFLGAVIITAQQAYGRSPAEVLKTARSRAESAIVNGCKGAGDMLAMLREKISLEAAIGSMVGKCRDCGNMWMAWVRGPGAAHDESDAAEVEIVEEVLLFLHTLAEQCGIDAFTPAQLKAIKRLAHKIARECKDELRVVTSSKTFHICKQEKTRHELAKIIVTGLRQIPGLLETLLAELAQIS